MALDQRQVLSGNFGKMYHDGEWLTNITSVQATIEIGMEEIKRPGSRWVGHKPMSLTASGTMSGYKITNKLAKKIAAIKSYDNKPFITELVVKLDDVSNPDGKTWVRLKNVQFTSIPVVNFEHGSTVTEEMPFTFLGYEYL